MRYHFDISGVFETTAGGLYFSSEQVNMILITRVYIVLSFNILYESSGRGKNMHK